MFENKYFTSRSRSFGILFARKKAVSIPTFFRPGCNFSTYVKMSGSWGSEWIRARIGKTDNTAFVPRSQSPSLQESPNECRKIFSCMCHEIQMTKRNEGIKMIEAQENVAGKGWKPFLINCHKVGRNVGRKNSFSTWTFCQKQRDGECFPRSSVPPFFSSLSRKDESKGSELFHFHEVVESNDWIGYAVSFDGETLNPEGTFKEGVTF